jgi:uncharacterized protein (DUF433 family)
VQAQAKLDHFARNGVAGFAYVSQACFLVLAASKQIADEARGHVLKARPCPKLASCQPRGSKMAVRMASSSAVHVDPEILSGTPVFVGTRVPFRALIDYLEGGHTLSEFLDDFPTVQRAQAVAALEEAGEAVAEHARTS